MQQSVTRNAGTPHEEISAWFTAKIPDDWFGDIEVQSDGDEILVIGTLPGAEEGNGENAAEEFREATRERRIAIAEKAEALFRRKVSWGVESGDDTWLFTHLTVPVMTRLRLPERRVLDTLVEGGVARSRSDALAWCVRLVRKHEADWISDLQESLVRVRQVRAQAPDA
jgi:hypothetical protein